MESEAEPLRAAVYARIAETEMTRKAVGVVCRIELGRGGEDIFSPLSFEEPATVGEGKFEFIAILACLL